jgi:small subunit ribosomal protein S20
MNVEDFNMAHTAASKKSIRKSEELRLLNKAMINRIRTERKKFLEAIKSDSKDVMVNFSHVQSLLAKAAKKGLMHWKTSARLVSRMNQRIKKCVTV